MMQTSRKIIQLLPPLLTPPLKNTIQSRREVEEDISRKWKIELSGEDAAERIHRIKDPTLNLIRQLRRLRGKTSSERLLRSNAHIVPSPDFYFYFYFLSLCTKIISIDIVSTSTVCELPMIKIWPTPVVCEMNVSAWKNELERFGLLDKHAYLLIGFKEGFHQGIPKHSIQDLKWYCPPNHSSALNVKDKIEKNLSKEVAARRMFGPFDKQTVFDHIGFFRSSPLGAVENGDKSF